MFGGPVRGRVFESWHFALRSPVRDEGRQPGVAASLSCRLFLKKWNFYPIIINNIILQAEEERK